MLVTRLPTPGILTKEFNSYLVQDSFLCTLVIWPLSAITLRDRSWSHQHMLPGSYRSFSARSLSSLSRPSMNPAESQRTLRDAHLVWHMRGLFHLSHHGWNRDGESKSLWGGPRPDVAPDVSGFPNQGPDTA